MIFIMSAELYANYQFDYCSLYRPKVVLRNDFCKVQVS